MQWKLSGEDVLLSPGDWHLLTAGLCLLFAGHYFSLKIKKNPIHVRGNSQHCRLVRDQPRPAATFLFEHDNTV